MKTPCQKYTKEEVDYGPSSSPAEHRCQICEYLLGHTPNHECGLVEGHIKDMDGCKLFSVNLIKAANDPITLASHPKQ